MKKIFITPYGYNSEISEKVLDLLSLNYRVDSWKDYNPNCGWASGAEVWDWGYEALLESDLLLGVVSDDDESNLIMSRDIQYKFFNKDTSKRNIIIINDSSLNSEEIYKLLNNPRNFNGFEEPNKSGINIDNFKPLKLTIDDILLTTKSSTMFENLGVFISEELESKESKIINYFSTLTPKSNSDLLQTGDKVIKWTIIGYILLNLNKPELRELITTLLKIIK